MSFLLNPNIGYILLIGGIFMAFLALFVPGTGVLEVGAFFVLFAAGYIMVNLPINGWALGLMAAALVPLVLAVRFRKGGWILLSISLVALFIGSLFVFRATESSGAVNPLVALLVSGGVGVMTWFMARKSLDAALLRPRIDQDRVLGMQGVARTDIKGEGSVYVAGESWSAHSREYIPAGTAVRVVRRSGLVLDVEKDTPAS